MANFTCGNDMAMGRSVMGCHNAGAELMGEGILNWLGITKSKTGKNIDVDYVVKEDTNRLNTGLAAIMSGTSDYKSIFDSIYLVDKTWQGINGNKLTKPFFPDGTWLPRIHQAWAETGNIFQRNAALLVTKYSYGLTAIAADEAQVSSINLMNEWNILQKLAYPVTKAQVGYANSLNGVKKLNAKLQATSKKLIAEGKANMAEAEFTYGKGKDDLEDEEGDFPIIPIAIAGAAAIGAIMIFKG